MVRLTVTVPQGSSSRAGGLGPWPGAGADRRLILPVCPRFLWQHGRWWVVQQDSGAWWPGFHWKRYVCAAAWGVWAEMGHTEFLCDAGQDPLWRTIWQHDQQVVRFGGKSGSGQKVDPAARAGSPSCCAWHVLCFIAQSCLTLCDLMNCSPPCSSIYGDSPGKNTGVGDFPNPGIEPTSPALQADSFTVQAFPEERL